MSKQNYKVATITGSIGTHLSCLHDLAQAKTAVGACFEKAVDSAAMAPDPSPPQARDESHSAIPRCDDYDAIETIPGTAVSLTPLPASSSPDTNAVSTGGRAATSKQTTVSLAKMPATQLSRPSFKYCATTPPRGYQPQATAPPEAQSPL